MIDFKTWLKDHPEASSDKEEAYEEYKEWLATFDSAFDEDLCY